MLTTKQITKSYFSVMNDNKQVGIIVTPQSRRKVDFHKNMNFALVELNGRQLNYQHHTLNGLMNLTQLRYDADIKDGLNV